MKSQKRLGKTSGAFCPNAPTISPLQELIFRRFPLKKRNFVYSMNTQQRRNIINADNQFLYFYILIIKRSIQHQNRKK